MSRASTLPRIQTARVTAGLKCAPLTCPPAKTMAVSVTPIASGARGAFARTVLTIVKTRKKVPMNSAAYLRIVGSGRSGGSGREEFQQAVRPEAGDVLVPDEARPPHPDPLAGQLVQECRVLRGIPLGVLDLLVGQELLVLGAQRAARGGVEHDVRHRSVSIRCGWGSRRVPRSAGGGQAGRAGHLRRGVGGERAAR